MLFRLCSPAVQRATRAVTLRTYCTCRACWLHHGWEPKTVNIHVHGVSGQVVPSTRSFSDDKAISRYHSSPSRFSASLFFTFHNYLQAFHTIPKKHPEILLTSLSSNQPTRSSTIAAQETIEAQPTPGSPNLAAPSRDIGNEEETEKRVLQRRRLQRYPYPSFLLQGRPAARIPPYSED
jgi:hypothetical protein